MSGKTSGGKEIASAGAASAGAEIASFISDARRLTAPQAGARGSSSPSMRR